jgi:hypothetical protein
MFQPYICYIRWLSSSVIDCLISFSPLVATRRVQVLLRLGARQCEAKFYLVLRSVAEGYMVLYIMAKRSKSKVVPVLNETPHHEDMWQWRYTPHILNLVAR